jgi:ribosomal protein S18 acetylase RimI-like enzyme
MIIYRRHLLLPLIFPLKICSFVIHSREFKPTDIVTTLSFNGVTKISALFSSSNMPITVERVSTKKRSLDVKVYRGLQMSPKEYISKRIKEENGNSVFYMTEEEAIDLLMKGYDKHGDLINHVSPNDRPVYFSAVYEPNVQQDDKSIDEIRELERMFSRQNGVMGIVSAQVKNRGNGNLKVIPPKNIHDLLDPSNLPSHVYLANMSVDDAMRRRGVGTQLLESVTNFCRALDDVQIIVLSVYKNNIGAVRLYESHGFKFFEENEDFGSMFLEASN